MSIAQLKKISIVGRLSDKESTLQFLQALACLHIIPLVEKPLEIEKTALRNAEHAHKALRFLSSVAQPRRQVSQDADFNVAEFVSSVLELKQSTRECHDKCDFLKSRIKAIKPWGNIDFIDDSQLVGFHFWFYQLPLKDKKYLDEVKLPWQLISADNRFLFVVLIAAEEPDASLLPVPRTHVGSVPMAELVIQLEETEVQLESLQAEQLAMTRYLTLLRQNLSIAETQAELNFAKQQTRDDAGMFLLQGWVHDQRVAEISQHTDDLNFAVLIEEPVWNEEPPTLLIQPEKEAAGVDMALFYQVPSYRSWDPTLLLMVSFSLFFSMIVADAGYGGVILLGLLFAWKRLSATVEMKAWRRMGLILAGTTIVYGVMVGSYFGMEPPIASILADLKIISLNDFDLMMKISIVVGIIHIVFANIMRMQVTRRRRSCVASFGWIGILIGGLALWLSGQVGLWFVIGAAIMTVGLCLIVFFTSERPIVKPVDWVWRIFDGVKSLTGVMGAFGDVLSYMRLFALGLASASLAMTFNNLAFDIIASKPGIGLLAGIFILAVGHLLNFSLAMMSGVVHGLRLNYIEFFKWGLPEEGYAFRTFRRKEVSK